MAHFFRKVTGQNLEEKMGVYLVAMEKMAAANPKECKCLLLKLLLNCCMTFNEMQNGRLLWMVVME